MSRRAGCAALWACCVLLCAGLLRAADRPSFAVSREGVLTVSDLPDVLSRPGVRPHLTTGLTTTFSLRVTATDENGHKVTGRGRIDIRWELWDEVFLTAAAGADGRARRDSIPADRLPAWWRGLELPAASGLAPGGRWDVEVDLSVIPFSASEQRDTQRWFSDSLGAQQSPGSPAPSGAPAPRPPDPNGVLDLLIATSIKRHSLATFHWKASPRTAAEHGKGGAA